MASTIEGTKGAAAITGSAQGIGLGIAHRLAEDGYGVVLNDLPSKQETLDKIVATIIGNGGRAVAVTGDVSVEGDVKNIVERSVTAFGQLDVMVSNAGIPRIGPLADTTVEDWDASFAVNVRGMFLCYREAAAQMIKQGRGGRIIGASSIAGKRGRAGFGVYSSTKFAIRGLTQSAACDYGKYGITVNAYAPGIVDTELTRTAADFFAKETGITSDQWVEGAKTISPLNTLGTPEDIAGLVSYLASPASRLVTGQTININGGIYFD